MDTERTPFEHVVIVGCGDVGCRVGRLLRQQGLPVTGLARTADSLDKITAAGLAARALDLDAAPLTLPPLAGALLYTLFPPPAQGEVDSRMQHLLAALSDNRPAAVVHISTTGVYGDRHGERVREDDAPNPQSARARRRLQGESLLRDWGRGQVPVMVLRVGGIYGPGRLPLERIRQGIPVLHPALSPSTNRIHVDDLAQVCVAAALRGRADQIYNVSDGEDSDMTEYFYLLADHFHLPRPPAVDWAEAERVMSAGMLSYLRESRRLDTTKMRTELDITLMHPSLAAWLASQ
ncbi:MAG: SDR family oxidoreductase [Gammaproteobacteria bacterium]